MLVYSYTLQLWINAWFLLKCDGIDVCIVSRNRLWMSHKWDIQSEIHTLPAFPKTIQVCSNITLDELRLYLVFLHGYTHILWYCVVYDLHFCLCWASTFCSFLFSCCLRVIYMLLYVEENYCFVLPLGKTFSQFSCLGYTQNFFKSSTNNCNMDNTQICEMHIIANGLWDIIYYKDACFALISEYFRAMNVCWNINACHVIYSFF